MTFSIRKVLTVDASRRPLIWIALGWAGISVALNTLAIDVINLLVTAGWLDVAYVEPVSKVAASTIGFLGALLTARIGENSVTPVSSPRDNDGNDLVPAEF